MENRTLVVGATGATGKHLVEQLLVMGLKVKAIVRSVERCPESWKHREGLSLVEASMSDMRVEEMADHLSNCTAAASCLGHNLTLKGIYGHPRKLVTNAVRLLSAAMLRNAPGSPMKLVLMNTAGCRNRDLDEPNPIGQRLVIGLLRALLPPHPDNEQAAEYLRVNVGQDNLEWVVVRPDKLINEDEVTGYTAHGSPTRNALFNPGKTSRINVGHFMASLIADNSLWSRWEGQMPVIYNDAS